MIREVNLKDISDGKLYTCNDMVKADCGDCKGCFACCTGMGQSIILDPLDVARLEWGLQMTFEELLVEKLELNVVDGVILPNIKMQPGKDCCGFLNDQHRCSVHPFRPGICRLFPLGRYYENRDFKYFLQVHECKNENRTKVKVKKWIGVSDIKAYEDYIRRWHFFLVDAGEYLAQHPEQMKDLSMQILTQFYLIPFMDEAKFYEEFNKRMNIIEQKIK